MLKAVDAHPRPPAVRLLSEPAVRGRPHAGEAHGARHGRRSR